jgi:hypothetical protein
VIAELQRLQEAHLSGADLSRSDASSPASLRESAEDAAARRVRKTKLIVYTLVAVLFIWRICSFGLFRSLNDAPNDLYSPDGRPARNVNRSPKTLWALMSAAVPFHFLGAVGGPVDEQLAADVAVAGGFSVPQLLAITGLVLDCLKSPKVSSRVSTVLRLATNRIRDAVFAVN